MFENIEILLKSLMDNMYVPCAMLKKSTLRARNVNVDFFIFLINPFFNISLSFNFCYAFGKWTGVAPICLSFKLFVLDSFVWYVLCHLSDRT